MDRNAPPRPSRRRRKEARPSELIEAGFREFAEHGFAATRLEDVARRAGVAKPTIYRYFTDKEALFVAVVRSKVPPIAAVEDLVDAFEGTTRELVIRIVTMVYDDVVDADLRTLMRIIVAEGPNFPGLVQLYHRESIAKVRPMLARVVARGVARGEIHADHAKLMPMMIVAPAIMAAVWKMTFDPLDPIDTKDFVEAHIELLTRGLLVPPLAPSPSARRPGSRRRTVA